MNMQRKYLEMYTSTLPSEAYAGYLEEALDDVLGEWRKWKELVFNFLIGNMLY
ncbi:hypothetical protein SAMN06297421_107105 [Aristaeella hokkaidonensis]|nr:hypothetical protein SAMN06297421_107105 [Aristaeella hokkaidonensis]